jgi:hypothetical protein
VVDRAVGVGDELDFLGGMLGWCASILVCPRITEKRIIKVAIYAGRQLFDRIPVL